MPPQPVEALLFDLGGVVIDIDVNRIFARWAQHAGCEASLIRSRGGLDAVYESYERGEIDQARYFRYVRERLGFNLTDAQLLDGWNAIFIGEMPGIGDVLRHAAARLPTYSLTNTNPAHEAFWSAAYGETMAHFRHIFVSSTIGLRKPDAAVFAHVADAINVTAARILFFDDVQENVDGARASGLQAVRVISQADIHDALDALWSAP